MPVFYTAICQVTATACSHSAKSSCSWFVAPAHSDGTATSIVGRRWLERGIIIARVQPEHGASAAAGDSGVGHGEFQRKGCEASIARKCAPRGRIIVEGPDCRDRAAEFGGRGAEARQTVGRTLERRGPHRYRLGRDEVAAAPRGALIPETSSIRRGRRRAQGAGTETFSCGRGASDHPHAVLSAIKPGFSCRPCGEDARSPQGGKDCAQERI